MASELTERVAAVERKIEARTGDIHFIYKELKDHRRILNEHGQILNEHTVELSWLRRAMGSVLGHFGIEPPPTEPAGEEE